MAACSSEEGMERFIFNTAEFAADDPEYFEVILKAAQNLK